MPTYKLNNLLIKIPFQPYPSQLQVITKLTHTLINNKTCLIESPTGTGKSISIIASIMPFLEDDDRKVYLCTRTHKQIRQMVMQIKQFFCSGSFIDKNFKEISLTENSIKEREIANLNESFESKDEVSIIGKSLTNSKENLINSQNNLTNSQTILTNSQKNLTNTNNNLTNSQNNLTNTNINLTNSQFTLKNTNINLTNSQKNLTNTNINLTNDKNLSVHPPKMSILGSRNILCINEKISHQPDINSLCTDLVKINKCKYFHNHTKASKHFQNKLFDLEDLISYSKRHIACPYYATKVLSEKASLILSPYNYLIDPFIRKRLGINKSHIVIDEAHNIEDNLREAGSLQISVKEMIYFTNQIYSIKDKDIVQLSELFVKLRKMFYKVSNSEEDITSKRIDNTSSLSNNSIGNTKFNNTNNSINNANNTNNNANNLNNNTNTNSINNTINNSSLSNNLNNNSNNYSNTNNSNNNTKFNNNLNNTSLSNNLNNSINNSLLSDNPILIRYKDLINLIKESFSLIEINNYKNIIYNLEEEIELDCLRTVEVLLYILTNIITNNKYALSVERNLFNFILLDISELFNQLVKDNHSLTLLSGTIGDVKVFENDLKHSFTHKVISDHVVPQENIFVRKVLNYKNITLIGTLSSMNESYYKSITTMVEEYYSVSKGGVLVFFQSYSLLQKIKKYFKIKLFIEPTSASELDSVINKFKIEAKRDKALLLGVYRGKLSEGIDFKDNYCRLVIAVSIPYPNLTDIVVKIKKENKYWYENQALKAVNQAVGRVIRHKDDYGGIILLDSRYKYKRLSQWIERSSKECSYEESIKEYKEFVRNRNK